MRTPEVTQKDRATGLLDALGGLRSVAEERMFVHENCLSPPFNLHPPKIPTRVADEISVLPASRFLHYISRLMAHMIWQRGPYGDGLHRWRSVNTGSPELATMEACFVELHALRADQVLQGPSIVKTIVPWNAAADNVVPLEDTESPPLIIGSKHPPNPNEGEQ